MVKERMDLLELMRKRGVDGDVDFLREALRVAQLGNCPVCPCPNCGYIWSYHPLRNTYICESTS